MGGGGSSFELERVREGEKKMQEKKLYRKKIIQIKNKSCRGCCVISIRQVGFISKKIKRLFMCCYDVPKNLYIFVRRGIVCMCVWLVHSFIYLSENDCLNVRVCAASLLLAIVFAP